MFNSTTTPIMSSTSRTPVLDNFSRDLSNAVDESQFPEVSFRKKEISKIKQIISKRRNNSTVLVGEIGVGKTATLIGFVQNIKQDLNHSFIFSDLRIVELDVSSLIAGANNYGQFEERINAIALELEKSRNIILFFEDFQSLFRVGLGTNSKTEQYNIFTLFKRLISSGTIRCVACATPESYQQFKDQYPSIERLFERINVGELNEEEVTEILFNAKEHYEEYHRVSYDEQSIRSCYELSRIFVAGGAFPDKAINLLDEVGANARYLSTKTPVVILDLLKQLDSIKDQKNQSVKNQQYEQAADLRDKESKIAREIEKEKLIWREKLEKDKKEITMDMVEEMVHQKTGVELELIRRREISNSINSDVEDQEYYKEKVKEHRIDEQTSINIDGIPEELLTCLQQYILFFRDYLRDVKGCQIEFNVLIQEGTLKLHFLSAELDDFGLIQTWFQEYLDLFRKKGETLFVNFEHEVSEQDSNIVMAELKNQIRFLESQIEVIQIKMGQRSNALNVVENLSLDLPKEQAFLIEKGHANINEFRLALKQKIAHGEFNIVGEEIINYLKVYPLGSFESLIDEVVLLNSRMTELIFKYNSGLLKDVDSEAGKNKINRAMLSLINRLK